ncbi:MAG: hypothetical protein J5691_01450 [Bacilli bacterium]|nr:hypothetical protein [Bacilli bacterium]
MAYERDSQEDLVWDSQEGEYVPAGGEEFTLTISPTPSDATVTLTAAGYTQSGNAITVIDGTTVSYSVAKTGYTTVYGAVTVTATNTIPVTLTAARPIVEESSIGTTVYDIHGKAIKNKNTVSSDEYIYNWVGTLAQYTAQDIEHTHPDWVCLITDDQGTNAGIGNSYTRTEVDSLIASVFTDLYPIGSLYFGTQSTCPLTTLIPGSTWVLVAQDRSIQGSSTNHAAGTTIEAGLPNITGTISPQVSTFTAKSATGAFVTSDDSTIHDGSYIGSATAQYGYDFDASRSSSIYGASSTVQPAVYVSNIWRRTA